jgi:branched-chain amino acid transport system permease protein
MRPALLAIGFVFATAVVAAPSVIGTPSVLRVGSTFFLMIAILAGLHVVTGLTQFISLCHAALVGVGAYAGALASIRFGAPAVVAICAGAAAAAVVAYVLAWLTRRLEDHYLALATLAAGEILANAFRGATSVTGGANGLNGVPPLRFLGVSLDTPAAYYPVCVGVGVLSLVIVWYLDRSKTGRALRAMGDEGVLIEALGVSTAHLRSVGFAVGGALAGTAGAVGAHIDGFVGPESFNVGLSIVYLCFLVIGGLGRIHGVIIGAALASIGPELLRGLYAWQMVVVAVVSLAVLVTRARSGLRVAAPRAGIPLSRGAHA